MQSADSTTDFLAGLIQCPPSLQIFPSDRYPAYSPQHLLSFLQTGDHAELRLAPVKPSMSAAVNQHGPLLFIAFSAGVVGAIAAARQWQRWGGQVKALLALDGWGVPLYGGFPIHRLSHDHFTHWSSALLGGGPESFYAEPAVPHQELWRSPHCVQGWWVQSEPQGWLPRQPLDQTRQFTTAAEAMHHWLIRYGELEKPPLANR